MQLEVICPKCGFLLFDNIFDFNKETMVCSKCKNVYSSYQGCVDFTVGSKEEKSFYENKYDKTDDQKSINFNDIRKQWYDPLTPEATIFLEEVTKYDVKGKNILLLGNGISTKELYFLTLGANIIYSDLSVNAVLKIKNKYDFKDYLNSVTFDAIGAYNIPFSDSSIDIVIGYSFVHHLDDLDRFLREVKRIL
jgi:ubiquinone/menaquinone biosynthesis C-methylase UbiE